MTHDILQSDIDFGNKLIHEGLPDTEIVQALGRRGIERSKAARLVDDLRQGRRLQPEVALSELGMSPAQSEEEASEEPSAPASEPASFDSTSPRHKPRVARWVILILLVGAIVGAVIFLLHHRTERKDVVPAETTPTHSLPKRIAAA